MLTKQNVFHGDIALLSTPLWFNTRVIPWRLPEWVKKGITTIGDILHENGEIYSIADFQLTWDIKCNFLLHMSLTNKIRLVLPQKDKFYSNPHPKLSHILYDIEIGNKGNKDKYHNTLRGQLDIVSDIKDKWSNSFNEEIGNDTVQKAFKTAKKLAPSVYQYYNQYKLLHRRTVNNQLLKRMNIVESENCLFCGQCPETIEHIYLLCVNAADLWRETTTWIRNIYGHHFIISDHEKVFGSSSDDQMTDLAIFSVKDVIYQKRKTGSQMRLLDVKKCVLKNLSILKSKTTTVDDIDTFEEKWDVFILNLHGDIHTRDSWYIL